LVAVVIDIEARFPIECETADEAEIRIREVIADFLGVDPMRLQDPKYAHIIKAQVFLQADAIEPKNANNQVVYSALTRFKGTVVFDCTPLTPGTGARR
jgi:hypothetical protein